MVLNQQMNAQHNSSTTETVALLESTSCPPLFPLGQIVISGEAMKLLIRTNTEITGVLNRHQGGDWNALTAEEVKRNEQALGLGGRVRSVYLLGEQKEPVWIVTTASRMRTTVSVPHESPRLHLSPNPLSLQRRIDSG